MCVIERRSDATQTCAPRVWSGDLWRLRSRLARVAKLVDAAVLNTAAPSGAWGFDPLPGHADPVVWQPLMSLPLPAATVAMSPADRRPKQGAGQCGL